jgi:small subunit ribosomal protein S6
MRGMAETLREYELVVIAYPQLEDEGITKLRDRIAGWITGFQGVVAEANVWGRRQLAYEIGKQTDGIYIEYKFQSLPSAVRELERNLRLEEQTLRHMIIRKDED